MKADRLPVLAGGFAILSGLFSELGITHMQPTTGALREGILYDLLGRMSDQDMREETVAEFVRRYHVDRMQATRVEELAVRLFNGIAPRDDNQRAEAKRFLVWAARLHEIGISIAHANYHKHSAYILENADMPGFSSNDQTRLALLTRAQRGALNKLAQFSSGHPEPITETNRLLVWMLRQAVILCRNRADADLSEVAAELTHDGYRLRLPSGWLDSNPLTRRALEEESAIWDAIGVAVSYA